MSDEAITLLRQLLVMGRDGSSVTPSMAARGEELAYQMVTVVLEDIFSGILWMYPAAVSSPIKPSVCVN